MREGVCASEIESVEEIYRNVDRDNKSCERVCERVCVRVQKRERERE